MTKEVRAAYYSFRDQHRRCSNPIKYPTYAGIKIEYTIREFIGWYLEKLKTFSGDDVTVGRIDHSGNYNFNNIELQTKSFNSHERNYRIKQKTKPISMYDYKTNTLLKTFQTSREAERYTGYLRGNILSICKGKYNKTKSGLTFRFHGMGDSLCQ